MIKCLYANGDSWTEGDELGLPYTDNTPTYRLQNSWPKLLSDKLDIPAFVNEGLRGTSQQQDVQYVLCVNGVIQSPVQSY